MYLTIKKSIHPCEFGYVLLTTTSEDAILHIQFGKSLEILEEYFATKFKSEHTRISGEVKSDKILSAIDKGTSEKFDLFFVGTPFQKSVWNTINSIPTGKVSSYQEIANQIGNPNAVRAIGTACGTNPIPVIVPCHRVVKANGDIGNYHYGSEMKRFLLKREGVLI